MQEVFQSNLASYLCWNKHVGKQTATMLAIKKLAGVTLDVNLKECISHMSLPNVNQAVHSGFETQRRHQQKSKTGVSVAPQKWHFLQFFFKKAFLGKYFIVWLWATLLDENLACTSSFSTPWDTVVLWWIFVFCLRYIKHSFCFLAVDSKIDFNL